MNLNFLKNLLLKGKLTVEGSAEIGTSNIATGAGSFAQGSDAVASGERSFAHGLEVTASGDGSHAEGYGTTASGLNSHAEGIETNATGSSSHTEGNNTSASGINTHAEGDLTVASGDNSHAEGNTTAATALGSHAEGLKTATGKRIKYSTYTYSTQVFTFTPDTSAEFNYVTPGTVLRGYDSDFLNNYFNFTVLNRSTVTGNITAVEAVIGGNSNNGFIINNSGEYAHVEGFESIASGLYSHAEGDYTEASGEASHAEGSFTIASGDHSHAEGGSTIASGYNSHAEGRFTEAKGNTSHAAGHGATAGHNYSYVWSDGELGTREPNLSSTREGQYAIDATGGIYIPRNVGIGTDSIDNALTVVGNISATQTVFASGLSINTPAASAVFVLQGRDTLSNKNTIIVDSVNKEVLSLNNRGTLVVTGRTTNNTMLSLESDQSTNPNLMRMQIPGSVNYQYFGVGTNGYVFLNTSGNAASPILTIENNEFGGQGRVGIGTGSGVPNEKLTVVGNISATGIIYTNNDIEITDFTKGIILRSPNGNRWRTTVTDSGTLSSVQL